MTRGDLAWYRQTIRGGYAYEVLVPCIYLGQRGVRAKIELILRNGERRTVHVLPENLEPRGADEPIPERTTP